jgi:hypothetical protein
MLNRPLVDFTDGDVTLHGGVSYGIRHQDDPQPFVNRGQFFNGILAHYKVNGITLAHDFLMYMMVRNEMEGEEVGTLYASRRFPLDRDFPNSSEFIVGIKQDNLVFIDQTHDITLFAW